jgi:hypothetical protein
MALQRSSLTSDPVPSKPDPVGDDITQGSRMRVLGVSWPISTMLLNPDDLQAHPADMAIECMANSSVPKQGLPQMDMLHKRSG